MNKSAQQLGKLSQKKVSKRLGKKKYREEMARRAMIRWADKAKEMPTIKINTELQ